jgi:hypothetical protein
MIGSKKGSVLIHVLLTGVLVSLLAAGLLSVMMLEYQVVERGGMSARGKGVAEKSLNVVFAYWTSGGGTVCANNLPSGYSITGAGACGCEVTGPEATRVKTVTCGTRCKICSCSADDATCVCNCP